MMLDWRFIMRKYWRESIEWEQLGSVAGFLASDEKALVMKASTLER